MKLLWLVIALCSIALYGPLNLRHARHYWKSAIDKRVPFLPIFVIPYLGLFPFVGFAFFSLYFTHYAIFFYASMTVCALLAAFFWYFFPTGIRRPRHIRDAGLRHAIREIYHYDRGTNAFPSSHVYLSLISGYFLALAFVSFAPVIWLIALLIAVSTVFVRQHELLDIAGGLLWAVVSITAVQVLLLA